MKTTARLIVELQELMALDYKDDWFPAAQRTMQETIAFLQRSGEMIDPLRALLAKWACPHHQPCPGCSCHFGIAARCDTCAAFNKFKAELDTLLSAPVGSPPPEGLTFRCVDACHVFVSPQAKGRCACGEWIIAVAAREWNASAPRGGGETRPVEEKP
jgi:hypothetical protein